MTGLECLIIRIDVNSQSVAFACFNSLELQTHNLAIMLLSTATHRKYAYTLLAAVVIVVLLAGNYAYNGHISREP